MNPSNFVSLQRTFDEHIDGLKTLNLHIEDFILLLMLIVKILV